MVPYYYGQPSTGGQSYSQTIPQIQTQQPSNSYSPIIPVNGRQGADSYPVAPGNTVVFLDVTSGLLYVKSRDAYGNLPVIEIYQKMETKEEIKMDQISRSDFDTLSKEVKELRDILDSLTK